MVNGLIWQLVSCKKCAFPKWHSCEDQNIHWMGFYLAVYRSLRLSIEHIVYTQCFGHTMCSNVEDFTFFNFISLFSSFLPCYLYTLLVNSCKKKPKTKTQKPNQNKKSQNKKKSKPTMHPHDCLSLHPECAFKVKLSKLFGTLVCSVKQTTVWECWK